MIQKLSKAPPQSDISIDDKNFLGILVNFKLFYDLAGKLMQMRFKAEDRLEKRLFS